MAFSRTSPRSGESTFRQLGPFSATKPPTDLVFSSTSSFHLLLTPSSTAHAALLHGAQTPQPARAPPRPPTHAGRARQRGAVRPVSGSFSASRTESKSKLWGLELFHRKCVHRGGVLVLPEGPPRTHMPNPHQPAPQKRRHGVGSWRPEARNGPRLRTLREAAHGAALRPKVLGTWKLVPKTSHRG